MTNTISIIILAHGNAELTRACIDSLRATVDRGSTEVLLFDNASPADQAQQLESLRDGAWLSYIRSDGNLGFAGGCNSAAERAAGDTLVFLNNDIVAFGGWLGPLLAALESPDVGMAGSLLLYPQGSVQHAGAGLGLWGLPAHLGRDGSPQNPELTRSRATMAVTAACLAIRADLFERLGRFDEAYFFSYEDVDLCLKARRAGLRTLFCPESRLVHYESATSLSSEVHKLRSVSEEQFVRRWGRYLERAIGRELARIEADGVRTAAVFGTGRAGRRMKKLLSELSGIELIGFVDSRKNIAGSKIDGLPVWLPAHVRTDGLDAVLGASMFIHKISRIAHEAGLGHLFRTMLLPDISDKDLAD